MPKRKSLNPKLVTLVGTRSRRRCCLCVFLDDHDHVVRGQIAHLNRNSADDRLDNLAFLCLNHHDEYDSKTSQSRGLSEGEVRRWRNELVRKYDGPNARWADADEEVAAMYKPEAASTHELPPARSWRLPPWQVDGEMELFAFSATFDGVCFIERIELPDGRSVIACIQAPGNPGTSVTNAAEKIATQVCERFEISPANLVWLEHYAEDSEHEWNAVTFSWDNSKQASNPSWAVLTPEDWHMLRLRPRTRLKSDGLRVFSKLRRLF